MRLKRPTSVVEAFLNSRQGPSLKHIRSDLRAFAAFTECDPADPAAVEGFLRMDAEAADALVARFVDYETGHGLLRSTINRRLSTLRNLVKMGRALGACRWTLDVRDLTVESFRDVEGMGDETFYKINLELHGRPDARSKCFLALAHVLHDMGLRRSTACEINFPGCFDWRAPAPYFLWVQNDWREMPESTASALWDWAMTTRGGEWGPLFLSFGPHDETRSLDARRLTPGAVGKILRELTKGE